MSSELLKIIIMSVGIIVMGAWIYKDLKKLPKNVFKVALALIVLSMIVITILVYKMPGEAERLLTILG